MTEEEAKTKWCPHAVASHTDPRRGFRASDEPDAPKEFHCIGARCMAWRLKTESVYKPNAGEAEQARLAPGGWHVDPNNRNYIIRKHGYCGLAGEP